MRIRRFASNARWRRAVSQSTPQNSSSESGADAPDPAAGAGTEPEAGVGLGALVKRLAEEFKADSQTLARVASLFREVRERAADLVVPAPGALAPALADAAAPEGASAEAIYAAVGEWALDAGNEPIERIRRDCQLFQSAMTPGVLRLHAAHPERCVEILLP